MIYDFLSVQGVVPYSPARIQLDPGEEIGPMPATPPYFLPSLAPGSANFEDSEPRSRHCQRPGHAVRYREVRTRLFSSMILLELQQCPAESKRATVVRDRHMTTPQAITSDIECPNSY